MGRLGTGTCRGRLADPAFGNGAEDSHHAEPDEQPCGKARRDERKNDGLNAFRGAMNGLLISLVFWVALGVALFGFF